MPRILQEPGRDAPGWFLRQWRDIAAVTDVAAADAAGLTARQAEQFVAQYEGQPGGGV
jgi:hypothetical protein